MIHIPFDLLFVWCVALASKIFDGMTLATGFAIFAAIKSRVTQ